MKTYRGGIAGLAVMAATGAWAQSPAPASAGRVVLVPQRAVYDLVLEAFA
jgi:hypothetical protein